MLAGERRGEGESFVPKKEPFNSSSTFWCCSHHSSNYRRGATQQKRRNRKKRFKGMRDAGSNLPAVAPGDAGQSNLAGGANTNSSAGGGFVALDVGALSSLAGEVGPPDAAATASPRPPRTPKVVRSLSRKGERKPADGDGNAGGGGERPPQLFVHVAPGDLGDANGARLVVHTPVAGTPGGKSRRLSRRPAPWLDPRRVVFLFATLSSVGTLILLYFTLSISRADSGGGDAAASDAR